MEQNIRCRSKFDTMFTKALLPDTFRALQLAGKVTDLSIAYLAGGSGLALHLGHRISEDLDFFTDRKFDEKILEAKLNQMESFSLKNSSWQTIMGSVGKTAFSLFYYPYSLLEKTIGIEGVNLASMEDIVAMKMEAIRGRGTRKDYTDIYFLAREFSWEKMFELYEKKYGELGDKLYEIIRILGYLDDAEVNSVMPEMLIKTDWDDIKKFFTRESGVLGKKYLLEI